MKQIWQYLYNYIFSPVFIIGIHLLSLFSKKIRKGLWPRYFTISKLRKWLEEHDSAKKRILFHTASFGEYEHIRPLLQTLKETFNTINIVTFFSPSGFENVKSDPYMDYYLYTPFDLKRNWKIINKIVNPSLVIIAKWDIWPAQIWTTSEMNIPLYLINASLRGDSRRIKIGVRSFLKHVFKDFSAIFAVSETDGQRLMRYFPGCQVSVVGDTKYDQVVLRKKHAQAQNYISMKWIDHHWIFIAGSIWPEDEEHLFPALKDLLSNHSQVRIILVPHQPEIKAVENIRTNFAKWGIKKFSERDNLGSERVLIIDAIGYLAGLYHYAHCAYVGGSFRQGIHNVMEPAIFAIPVLYGPVHENSHEAMELARNNGGYIVNNSTDITRYINLFLDNDEERQLAGNKAENFALRNTGATQKLMKNWADFLKIPSI